MEDLGIRIFIEEFEVGYDNNIRTDLDDDKVLKLIGELKGEIKEEKNIKRQVYDKKYAQSEKGRARQERSNAKRREKRRLAKIARQEAKKC